ncbi:MAG: hypothetical protein GXY11_08520 [Clostridiales bacterium]|nr:hypothetical protein [Clostridiales bacterium]
MQPVMQADYALPAAAAAPGQAGKTKERDDNGFFSLLNAVTNGMAAREAAKTPKASEDAESGLPEAGAALLMMLLALQAQAPEEGYEAAKAGGGATGIPAAEQEAAEAVPAALVEVLAGMEGTAKKETEETGAGSNGLIEIPQQTPQKPDARVQHAGDAQAPAPKGASAPVEAAPKEAAANAPETVIEQITASAGEQGPPKGTPAATEDGGTPVPKADVKAEPAEKAQPGNGAPAKDANIQAAPAKDAGERPDAGRTSDGGRQAPAETPHPVRKETAVQPLAGQDTEAEGVQPGASFFESGKAAAKAGILEQVAGKAAAGIKQGKYQMSIQLRPEHLGKVSVKVTMDAEGMVVKIHAENETAKSAISGEVAQLEQALKDRGITVVRMEVQESLQDGAGQPGHPNDPRQNRREYTPQDDGDAGTACRETLIALQEYIYGNTVEFRA